MGNVPNWVQPGSEVFSCEKVFALKEKNAGLNRCSLLTHWTHMTHMFVCRIGCINALGAIVIYNSLDALFSFDVLDAIDAIDALVSFDAFFTGSSLPWHPSSIYLQSQWKGKFLLTL
jgi:hypothetical protein